ncbi:hypothetical protein ACFLXX_02280 [Chloroflexota bacterium]
MATLAGVFIAFQISNYQETQNEKEFTVGLLSESAYQIELETKYVNERYPSNLESVQNDEELEKLIEARSFHGVISTDILLNSTLLSKFGSPYATTIHSTNRELEEMRVSINSPAINPNQKLALIESYIQKMSDMRELLLLEILYIEGDISCKEVEKEYNRLQQVR